MTSREAVVFSYGVIYVGHIIVSQHSDASLLLSGPRSSQS